MGSQRTGFTSGRPGGGHRGSCSNRCPGCQWHLPPEKSRARRSSMVFLCLLIPAWDHKEQMGAHSEAWSAWSAWSATDNVARVHYLSSSLSTGTAPSMLPPCFEWNGLCVLFCDLNVELNEAYFCCQWNKTLQRDGCLGTCLLGLSGYFLFSGSMLWAMKSFYCCWA